MKICFISDSYKPIADGVVRYFDYVIPALIAEGHEVTLICPWYVGTKHYEYPMDGFKVVRCTTTHIQSEDYWWALPDWRMLKALRPADFVVIHSLMPLGILGGFLAKILRKKIGLFVHQDERLILQEVLGLSRAYTNFVVTFISKLYYPLLIDVFFHATERFKGKLLDFGVPEQKIYHTPFAINSERFHPGEPDYDLRERYDIPEDAIVAVYVGRLAKEKNVGNLLKGLDLAMEEEPKLYALMCGGGPDWDYYSSLPRKHSERFIFTGFVPEKELRSHYVTGDFFTSPSINESSCFTVFEAMSCKLPVITSAYRHDPDIIHKENAVLVNNVLSPEKIKESVLLLAQKPKLRAKIARNGYELVDSRSWEYHAKAFLQGVRATFAREESKKTWQSIAQSFRKWKAEYKKKRQKKEQAKEQQV